MRPINLIPESERPARASGSKSGSAYVVIGVLAGLLVLVAVYVLTANQVNTRKEQAVEAKADADQADARAGTLGRFGDFAKVKVTRAASVRTLSGGRFDWERLLRELALVLPDKTFLSEMDASVSPQEGEDAGGEAVTLRAPSGGPRAKLKGCARGQSDVAKLMVRLRQMHEVEDVGLTQSSLGESEAGGSGSASSSDSGGGCGRLYEFELVVAFKPTAPAEGRSESRHRVPARLGGGS